LNTGEIFEEFLANLAIKNRSEISNRYKRITKKLNKKYYDSESETNHSLQVGSYGRGTAINGISDLDMIFELPWEVYDKYDEYESNGQSALLQEVKNCIKETYPNTDVSGDGQVVVVSFKDYKIEVLPGFLNDDSSYTYPDSNDGGSWKTTNPRPEISEINKKNKSTNGNLKQLCKMIRSWKNKNGIAMSGLLIDTFCYNFFNQTESYNDNSFSVYDALSRDFFEYLKEQNDNQNFWHAPGSNQRVYRTGKFKKKAKKANELCLEAIAKKENKTVYSIWRKIYGNAFPYPNETTARAAEISKISGISRVDYNEQFIEDLYNIDIRYSLKIDCRVTPRDGFRTTLLSEVPFLKTGEKLNFFIVRNYVSKPYKVLWKVRNCGDEAIRRNEIRGEIFEDKGLEQIEEISIFRGLHFVECYIVKNNVCVARDKIEVPILVSRH